MDRANLLVQVLVAFWIGVLFTQLAIDNSAESLRTALGVGALGTVGFVAAHGIIGFFERRGKVKQPD